MESRETLRALKEQVDQMDKDAFMEYTDLKKVLRTILEQLNDSAWKQGKCPITFSDNRFKKDLNGR